MSEELSNIKEDDKEYIVKRITELLGDCYHDWKWEGTYWRCIKCNNQRVIIKKPLSGVVLSSWYTFGKLVEYIQRQPWKDNFFLALCTDRTLCCYTDAHVPFHYIDPLRFAMAVWLFVGGEKIDKRIEQ